MARQVKLVDTGEIVEKTKAYQAPNRKWYSSEDAYLAIDLDNTARANCIDKMFDILGYNQGQKISTLFLKRLKEWREGYDYRTISIAIDLCRNAVDFALQTKRFDNETAKVMYVAAIIQNNLNDALNITKLEHKVKQKSASQDLEAMADGMETLTNMTSKRKASDVRHLAGEL